MKPKQKKERPYVGLKCGNPIQYESVLCGDKIKPDKNGCNILFKSEDIVLKITAGGKHVLSLLLGGIGLYEAVIQLDNHEIERYQQEGDKFICDLSYKISKNESLFEKRLKTKD